MINFQFVMGSASSTNAATTAYAVETSAHVVEANIAVANGESAHLMSERDKWYFGEVYTEYLIAKEADAKAKAAARYERQYRLFIERSTKLSRQYDAYQKASQLVEPLIEGIRHTLAVRFKDAEITSQYQRIKNQLSGLKSQVLRDRKQHLSDNKAFDAYVDKLIADELGNSGLVRKIIKDIKSFNKQQQIYEIYS